MPGRTTPSTCSSPIPMACRRRPTDAERRRLPRSASRTAPDAASPDGAGRIRPTERLRRNIVFDAVGHAHDSGAAERRRHHHRSNRAQPLDLSLVGSGCAEERQHQAARHLRRRDAAAPGDLRAAAVPAANDEHERQDRVGDPRASECRGSRVDRHGVAGHPSRGGDVVSRQRHWHGVRLLPVRSGDRRAAAVRHLHATRSR